MTHGRTLALMLGLVLVLLPAGRRAFGEDGFDKLIDELDNKESAARQAEARRTATGAKLNHTSVSTVAVSHVEMTRPDPASFVITFDLAWENSWRNDVDHDAAWVFFKLRPEGGVWEHLSLVGTGVNPPGFSPGAEAAAELLVPPDRLGVFVRRARDGAGTFTPQHLRVVCAAPRPVPATGPARADDPRLLVQAVEMVYVSQGPNVVGGGGHDRNEFYAGGTESDPFTIRSEAALEVADRAGALYYGTKAGHGGDQAGPIPAAFPKGFAPFYCMKYELTEKQWVDFFNTLTPAQKETRDITSGKNGGKNTDEITQIGGNPRKDPWFYRNTIAWTSGDATTSEPALACSYLSWADGCAWADWAGLRPMTELEYVKAYVAAEANPTRAVMYLPGSVAERAVSVGNEAGRRFDARHGDGKIDPAGEADVPGWPGPDEVGVGALGGYGTLTNPHYKVTDRAHALYDKCNRHSGFGWRGVRSVPLAAPQATAPAQSHAP